MTTEYSISVSAWDDSWNYIGKDIMYEHYMNDEETIKECEENNWDLERYAQEQADANFPMMLYAYPLYEKIDEDKIKEICLETSCTVVENNDTGDWYLALCGGGMDLSQSIALAYIIAQGWIPSSLANNVSTQYGLNFSGEKYFKVMNGIKKSLQNEIDSFSSKIKDIDEAIQRAEKKQEE